MPALPRKVRSHIGQSLSIAFTSSEQRTNWLTEAYRLAHLPSYVWDDPECQWREPQSHSGTPAPCQSQGHNGQLVQAVTDEKRKAQNKVVKVLLPGIRGAVI